MSKIALTVDYEFDWGGRVGTCYGIEKMLYPVLEILDTTNSKVTFFISTETINATRDYIRAIQKAGHEIASHGHTHNLRYDLLSREELREQIKKSKYILEDFTGERIAGFRTPQFRKNKFTEELLKEAGYKYDSSSVSARFLHHYSVRQQENNLLPELPVSAIYGFFPAGMKWINFFGNGLDRKQQVNIVYFHLFDLLSIRDMICNYSKNVKTLALIFYLSRRGNPFRTFQKFSHKSVVLKSLIAGNQELWI